MNLALDSQYSASILPRLMFYLTEKAFSVSYVSYEDAEVSVTTVGLKAALMSFNLVAPSKINQQFGGGIKL